MDQPRLQDRDFDVLAPGLLLVLASGGALRCLHLNSEAAAGLWARETSQMAPRGISYLRVIMATERKPDLRTHNLA